MGRDDDEARVDVLHRDHNVYHYHPKLHMSPISNSAASGAVFPDDDAVDNEETPAFRRLCLLRHCRGCRRLCVDDRLVDLACELPSSYLPGFVVNDVIKGKMVLGDEFADEDGRWAAPCACLRAQLAGVEAVAARDGGGGPISAFSADSMDAAVKQSTSPCSRRWDPAMSTSIHHRTYPVLHLFIILFYVFLFFYVLVACRTSRASGFSSDTMLTWGHPRQLGAHAGLLRVLRPMSVADGCPIMSFVATKSSGWRSSASRWDLEAVVRGLIHAPHAVVLILAGLQLKTCVQMLLVMVGMQPRLVSTLRCTPLSLFYSLRSGQWRI